jgi:glycosyltransferase involved in cell wall biosynthesis
MTALDVLSWTLLAVAVPTAIWWFVVLVRVALVATTRPTVRSGIDLPEPEGGWPSVSVVVPAHNEERVIERCGRSLLDQNYPRLQPIFVLDRCTDATAERLRSVDPDGDRLQIIENDSCPADWAGKCNAARIGAEQATGDLLLFMDADTGAEPDVIRAAVALLKSRGLGLLSLLSTLTCEHDFEFRSQSVATMALLYLYPPDMVNNPRKSRAFANGQFMLFDRGWYERIGGHASVKDDLLEDIAFAQRISWKGGLGNILMADGLFSCSMYSSRTSFRRGWQRIFIESCRRKPARMRKLAYRLLLTGVFMPVAMSVAIVIGAVAAAVGDSGPGFVVACVAAAGLILQAVALGWMAKMGRQPIRTLFLHPMGCLEVAGILRSGADLLLRGEPVVWGGREYVLEAR